MANSLTNIFDKILAEGLNTLREAAVMPRLVNTNYSAEAGRFGQTIDIPKPVAQTVSDVNPGVLDTTAASNTPGLVQIQLDKWKKTDFFLTDKDMVEIERGRHFLPMQTREAIRSMANQVDGDIHGRYHGVYGYTGTAGTTPFGSTVSDLTAARRLLNEQLAPMNGRMGVWDPAAEEGMLKLSAFSDVEKVGERGPKIEGTIGRKFGIDNYMSQNVGTHTAGTIAVGGTVLVGSTTAAGLSSLDMVCDGAPGTVVYGDVFSISGNDQTYAITTSATVTLTSANQEIAFQPPLAAVASANAVVTFKGTHVVNLVFTEGAFALASRPIAQRVDSSVNTNPFQLATDPLTGLTFRLELIRQNKQTKWEFDTLYGTKLVREQFAVRVAG